MLCSELKARGMICTPVYYYKEKVVLLCDTFQQSIWHHSFLVDDGVLMERVDKYNIFNLETPMSLPEEKILYCCMKKPF